MESKFSDMAGQTILPAKTIISKEDIKEYVYEAIDGALIRKYGDSLVMEHVELKQK